MIGLFLNSTFIACPLSLRDYLWIGGIGNVRAWRQEVCVMPFSAHGTDNEGMSSQIVDCLWWTWNTPEPHRSVMDSQDLASPTELLVFATYFYKVSKLNTWNASSPHKPEFKAFKQHWINILSSMFLFFILMSIWHNIQI